jgi:hypothetical protein
VSLPAVLVGSDGSWRSEVHVADLGLGGAGLLVREMPPLGADVLLELASPGLWDPLVLAGVIRWSAPPDPRGNARVGVVFAHRQPGALCALVELITTSSAQ